MPLRIHLQRLSSRLAEARLGEGPSTTFEWPELLGDPREGEWPSSDLRAYGQRLWAALGGEALSEALATLPRAPMPGNDVIIHTDEAELSAIPWEYSRAGEALVLLNHFLVREVPGAPTPPAPEQHLPWRFVAQGSEPLLWPVRDKTGAVVTRRPMVPVTVAAELQPLRHHLLTHVPPPPIRWHRIAPTKAALIALPREEPILYHYAGHADVWKGQAFLCLEDDAGRMESCSARALARHLRGSVYLAFLNACRTADGTVPGTSLAFALVQEGIPVVVGMQRPITTEVAAQLAWTFYRHLAAGASPAEALWRARQQVHEEAVRGIPALFVAQGYAWPRQKYARRPEPVEEPPLNVHALWGPTRFFDRAVELTSLASLLLERKKNVVTVRGAGGIGKTALVHALAQRLHLHFEGGVHALSLALPAANTGLDAAALRLKVAELLGVHGHQAFRRGTSAEEQEQVIVGAAKSRPRMLLIFDNYETVLWRLGQAREAEALPPDVGTEGPEPFSAQERGEAEAIQRLVLRLAHQGPALLFTTREASVGLPGTELYPPEKVGPLGGLDERNSVRLFALYGGSRPRTADFPATVSRELGYSPLGIQLAAAHWASSQQSEAEFLANLSVELLSADLAGMPPQLRSAVASVRLSLRALPPPLRDCLLALSLVGNPVIRPIHGAVVWGFSERDQYDEAQASAVLERLSTASLLQQVEDEPERGQTAAYSLQPVIASVLRSEAARMDLSRARTRYARWVVSCLDRASGKGGMDYDTTVAWELAAMLEDLPAAIPFLPETERAFQACRAAQALASCGHFTEAERMLERARQWNELAPSIGAEGWWKITHARLLMTRGRREEARDELLQAYPLSILMKDRELRQHSLHECGKFLWEEGDVTTALHCLVLSLEDAVLRCDHRGLALVVSTLGEEFLKSREFEDAEALSALAADILEKDGEERARGVVLHQRARIALEAGHPWTSRTQLREALALAREAKNPFAMASAAISLFKVQFGGCPEAAFINLGFVEKLLASTADESFHQNVALWMVMKPDYWTQEPVTSASQLVNSTSQTLLGEVVEEAARAELEALHEHEHLMYLASALVAALDRKEDAASRVFTAVCELLEGSEPGQRLDLLMAVGFLAGALGAEVIRRSAYLLWLESQQQRTPFPLDPRQRRPPPTLPEAPPWKDPAELTSEARLPVQRQYKGGHTGMDTFVSVTASLDVAMRALCDEDTAARGELARDIEERAEELASDEPRGSLWRKAAATLLAFARILRRKRDPTWLALRRLMGRYDDWAEQWREEDWHPPSGSG